MGLRASLPLLRHTLPQHRLPQNPPGKGPSIPFTAWMMAKEKGPGHLGVLPGPSTSLLRDPQTTCHIWHQHIWPNLEGQPD